MHDDVPTVIVAVDRRDALGSGSTRRERQRVVRHGHMEASGATGGMDRTANSKFKEPA